MIVLLNLAFSQNINWQLSSAKAQLLSILQVLHKFQETLHKESEKLQTISKIESTKKNCWLPVKMLHSIDRNVLKQCIKQALGRKSAKFTAQKNGFLQLKIKSKIKEQKLNSIQQKVQSIRLAKLKTHKHNARKHLQELGEIYKRIVMLERHHKGLARMT
jgi:hypothetical protein